MELDEEAPLTEVQPPADYNTVGRSEATPRDVIEAAPARPTRAKSSRMTLDEVFFNMRYAHENKGFDWSEEVDIVRSEDHDRGATTNVTFLNKLREQPICIADKLKLSRYLRLNVDAESLSSSSRYRNQPGQVAKRYNQIEIGLWRSNITKISAYHGSNVASYFHFLKFLTYLNAFIGLLLLAFTSLPQIISGDATEVTGMFGQLSASVMFYGAYSNSSWGVYERPLAYFFTWASAEGLCFIVIIASMWIRFRRSKYGSTDEEFPFTWRLFTSWDFSVYNKQGAWDRRTAITTEIKETIRSDRSYREYLWCSRLVVVIVRLLVNIVVLGVLGGSGYLIYIVANSMNSLKVPDFFGDFFNRYELPLVVAGLKLIVPFIFRQLIRLEQWQPRTELKLTIARTTLFYVASLIVFVASLYQVTAECSSSTDNTTSQSTMDFCCWENEVGEQVFKVLILDLGITLVVGLCFDVIRVLLVKYCTQKLGHGEMDVASGVLDLTYGQALVWLGLYFSPFLALVGLVKLVIIFYFRYVIARTCQVPPRNVFRASRSGNFYMMILLLNLFFSVFPLAYAVIVLKPSEDCGPFRGKAHVYNIVSSRIGQLPDWLQKGLDYLGTPAVIIPIVIFLILVIFYFMARSFSYKQVSRQLQDHLTFERRVEKRKIFAKGRGMQERSKSKTSVSSSVF